MSGVVAPGDEHDVVEAEPDQALQALPCDGARALEIARIVGPVGARRLTVEVHLHVGDDRPLAAEPAELHDAVLQRTPAAARARADPAVELLRRPLDPAGARPRTDQDRRSADGGGPDR